MDGLEEGDKQSNHHLNQSCRQSVLLAQLYSRLDVYAQRLSLSF